MALTAIQVSCERDDRILFKDINVAVNSGEMLHIIGKNGAGKTTLIKILSGLLLPSQGSITWDGIAIAKCRSSFHQQLCYIGHINAVNLQLSAIENLTFVAKAYDTKVTIATALQQLGMAQHANLVAAQLSAGQRRRIALAKLCLVKVKLWLLDEPYTAQDDHGIAIINNLMLNHLNQGGMIIITSHQSINLTSVIPQELILS